MQIFDARGAIQTMRAALIILFILLIAGQPDAGRPTAHADAAVECEDAPTLMRRQPPVDAAIWRRIMAQIKEEHPFARAASGASETARLTASDGASGDSFGASLAIAGDTIVVGAPFGDVGEHVDQGSAHVFERNHGGPDAWGQVQKLIASDGGANDQFGFSVAIHGDTIVVGASENTVGDATAQGSAYVFERDQGGANAWGQTAQLIADDGAACDRFGVSVAVDGDTVGVGAYFDQVNANPFQGSAYIFERNKGGVEKWGQVKQVTASDGQADDAFGVSLALDGDTLVVGAALDDVSAVDQGSAYVFERNQGGANGWGEIARLTDSGGAAKDNFGFSVAAAGHTIVVGAPYRDIGANDDQGAAFLFERNQGGANGWGQTKLFAADDGAGGDSFGAATAVSGDVIVIGAYLDNVAGSSDQGAAYAFGRNQGGANAWGLLSKYTADKGGSGDHFGVAVGVSGDTLVVGADAIDINGNGDQGAAYVFAVEVGLADLALHKNVTPGFGAPGAAITYTLSFSNVGAGFAIGVGLKDILPTGLAVTGVTSATLGSGVVITQTAAPPILVWSVSDLAPGAGGVITIRAATDASLPVGVVLQNSAQITATNDTRPENNVSGVDFRVAEPVFTVYLPTVTR